MDFSIVVPIYNEEKHIEGCIEALLAQEYPADQYEIIMVDNNSTDRSAEIVRRYPRVKLVSETTQGDFAARNRGIAESRGALIAFTDSDTAPYPDWLQSIATAMKDPGVELIIGNLQFSSRSRALAMMADYETEKARFIFSGQVKEIYFGYTCNMIVRKSLFAALGPFPAVYRNADVVFVRQAVDQRGCEAVVYSPEVRVRRLEINSLWDYFRKQVTYGRDFKRYGEMAAARPLNFPERLQAFKRTVTNRNYSLLQSTYLFFLLSIGGLVYESARRS